MMTRSGGMAVPEMDLTARPLLLLLPRKEATVSVCSALTVLAGTLLVHLRAPDTTCCAAMVIIIVCVGTNRA